MLRTLVGLGSFLCTATTATEVAVDVGHTVAKAGAISARGRSEFEFNLALARAVRDALAERGLKVREINFDGRIEDLETRPRHAAGAGFFLSVHHDSVDPALLEEWDWDGTAQTFSNWHRGFSLFVSPYNPDFPTSSRCASAIGARLRRAGFTPATHYADPVTGPPREASDFANGVYLYPRLIVLYRTTLPAVLFEAGVIKHRDEELTLLDAQRRSRMADAIVTGVAACLYAR